MIRLISDKIIVGQDVTSGSVYINDGKIAEVSERVIPCQATYYFTGKYVSAGFVDMHTHGGGGFAFVNSTDSDVVNGCNFHLKHGTTSILPTISAAPFDVMRKAVINIATAQKDVNCNANIIGSHLEGPYLSAEQCGAQCPTFITKPDENDYKTLVEQYGDSIARWTFAAENDDGSFCKYITEHGILASIGHSNAKLCDVDRAISNGAKLITHLYSCTSTVTRNKGFRSLGVIESAFLRDELFVEIIADGKHLPSELVQMIVKIKGDKVAAITDSLEIAGTDITSGTMSGTDFIVEDGVCKLKDRSAFAGSVATADRLVRVLTNCCGYSLPRAVAMLTQVPCKVLQLNKGTLAKGYDADVIVFDDDINVSDVFVAGDKVI